MSGGPPKPVEQLTCHRLKECCVKLHSCVHSWAEVNSNGFEVATKLVNVILELQHLSSSKSRYTEAPPKDAVDVSVCKVGLIAERESLLLKLKENLANLKHILGQMGALVTNFMAITDLVRAQGHRPDLVVFETLPVSYFDKHAQELFVAYSEELSLKEHIFTHFPNQENYDTLRVYLSCWLHQPFLRPQVVDSLEALLEEVGLRH